MATVLIIGATGNIGVSAVIGALRAKHRVLAIVRNEKSAEKMFQNVGSRDGITTVVADVMSETGVKGVVDQVRAGKLPPFQHVFSCAGGFFVMDTLSQSTVQAMRDSVRINFEPNFYAYEATIKYLVEQNDPKSSYTIVTGMQGDIGYLATLALGQGALIAMTAAACHDTAQTNVRFNEICLGRQVAYDKEASKSGADGSSEFGQVYAQLLTRQDIKGSRIAVVEKDDLVNLKFRPKSERPVV